MNTETSPWSLEHLFPAPNSLDLENAFAQIETAAAVFEEERAALRADISAEPFFNILTKAESTRVLVARLDSYAGLLFAADTQNQIAMALMGRVQQFLAGIENRLLFFSLWWKELDEENARRLMSVAGDFRYYLEEMRNFKAHTRSEAEEKIINLKNVTGSSALIQLYDSITNRYIFNLEINGETCQMTRGELMSYARNADPELRAKAYREMLRVYSADASVLGQMYQTRVRDWHNENVSLRKFASPIAARNLFNNIPNAAVDTLLDVARKNAGIFQRFFKLKARHLGMEKLRRYDVYAPVSRSDKSYDFSSALKMVLDSFNAFDPHLGALAKKVFDDKHLDSEVRKGKQGGAFCASVEPTLSPWVQVNYQGRADDVTTLAHELGHAIHSMLAAEAGHNVFTFHSSLPLAETASTFGEMMLVERLLSAESDAAARRDLLFQQVDGSYVTILRQVYFALFEREAHQLVMQNASVDELADAYMKNLKEQFGDALELSEDFKWEWVSIPHIYHTPFYVYAYAFGQLLVFSLYQQFKLEGDAFKPRYLKILSAGGAEVPEKILSEAGIDIRSADFWQGGFDVLNGLVSRLENME